MRHLHMVELWNFVAISPTYLRGNQTITTYMKDIKNYIDSLALMNKPMNFDELSTRNLNGLDLAYSKLSHVL